MQHFKTRKDIQVPKLGLGTWQAKGDECTKAVEHGLQTGYRHIDTAQIYKNEQDVGNGIKSSAVSRDEIFLTTKVWIDQFQHDDVIVSTEESLKKLQTDYVDLLLVHWPNESDASFEETLRAFEELEKQGKTRLIGISNFTVNQMKQIVEEIGAPVVTNQVEYHPYIPQDPVLTYLRAKNMFLTAYSPIAQGEVMDDEILRDIGLKYGKSAVQVTLRWLIQQKNVVAIPKSSTPEHIERNLQIFDFELDPHDMAEIDRLSGKNKRLISPDFAPKWDTAKDNEQQAA